MTANFDESGDLWVQIQAGCESCSLPKELFGPVFFHTADGSAFGTAIAAQQFNITAYIRHLMKPDWLNAALTSSSANITIEQHKDWLATIPDPIEYQYSDLERKLRAECESGFVIGPVGVGPYSVTGETFELLCRGPYATAEAAYEVALADFRAYVTGKPGVLYWRTFPEIAFRDQTGSGLEGWATYMRVLVSDKATIPDPIEPNARPD